MRGFGVDANQFYHAWRPALRCVEIHKSQVARRSSALATAAQDLIARADTGSDELPLLTVTRDWHSCP